MPRLRPNLPQVASAIARHNLLGDATSINAVAGLFLATVLGSATYYTSPEGTTWTARTTPAAISLTTSVLLAGANPGEGSDGVFFLTGAFADATGFCFYSSSDGINWARRALPYVIGGAALTYFSGDGGATLRMSQLGASATVTENTVCGFYSINGTTFMNSAAEYVGFDTVASSSTDFTFYTRIA